MSLGTKHYVACADPSSIGQKLSERVESFNFTHAINDLRRQINVELGTDAIRGYLRKDLGGIMALPVRLICHLRYRVGLIDVTDQLALNIDFR